MYRAHPNYHGNGKPWYDHAFVKWRGNTGKVLLHPARVHVLIDLNNVLPRSVITFPESEQVGYFTKPGFYAIVESYDPVEGPCPNNKVNSNKKMDADFDFSVFRKFHLTLLSKSSKPKLFLVHVDSIVGPTVAIPDAFGDNPIQVSGPSIPNVDYIFLTLRQHEWAQTWESFIIKQDLQVNGPDGHESNDSDYNEEGHDPFFIDADANRQCHFRGKR